MWVAIWKAAAFGIWQGCKACLFLCWDGLARAPVLASRCKFHNVTATTLHVIHYRAFPTWLILCALNLPSSLWKACS